MKKGSGFEKFFKGREKTGAAKKENIRQEKREIRKEREEKIANAKREKRAKYKAANSGEPPKYNLQPPGSRVQKKQREDGAKSSNRKENSPFKKDFTGNRNNDKRFDFASKTNNRSTKPGKWDGAGPNKAADQKPNKTARQKPYSSDRKDNRKTDLSQGSSNRITKPEKWDGPGPNKQADQQSYKTKGQAHYSNNSNNRSDKHKVYKSNSSKSHSGKESRPYQSGDAKEYGKRSAKPYKDDSPKPVIQKKELPQKIGHKDQAGAHLREESQKKQLTTGEIMPLNKYIAHSGVCSRRDAVDLIKGGKVKVNGELIFEPGHKVALSDDVKVAGKKMNPVKDFVYILLNKPKDYITTTDDPQERKTVIDLLKGAPQVRIYPVGRLDRNTSGVLLLTNDGDLSQKLTHPSNEIKKVYAVTLDKPLTRNHFDDILKGVALEDGMANVDSLAFTDTKDHTQIGIELHTGRNRIVRRIFEHFGYDVKALDRVIFAGLTKKNVNRGKWRFLTEKEVRDLKFFKKGR